MTTCLRRFLRVGARQYVRAVQTHPQLQLGAALIRGLTRAWYLCGVYWRAVFIGGRCLFGNRPAPIILSNLPIILF